MTIYNFSAGPALLPQDVLREAQRELTDWHDSGMSVMEMSHRGREFMSIHAQAEADLRELLQVPDNYRVLFLQGGAHSQFSMVPMNLLRGKTTADYVITGHWGDRRVLFLEAAIEYARENFVVPDNGNLRDDLLGVAAALVDPRRKRRAGRIHLRGHRALHGGADQEAVQW